jgi:hypothetical protein
MAMNMETESIAVLSREQGRTPRNRFFEEDSWCAESKYSDI